MIPKLYTRKETAEMLRVDVTTLNRYVLDGKIRSTKQGRRRFFTEDHIMEFINNGEA